MRNRIKNQSLDSRSGCAHRTVPCVIDVPYTHIMLGVAGMENADGTVEYYAVRSEIQERKNQNPILIEADVYGKLYAVNANKISSPHARVADINGVALTTGSFEYKIADLLKDVKSEFSDTFSVDVYHHLKMIREKNDFSNNLLYKLPVGSSVTAEQVQAAKEKVARYQDALKEAKGDTQIMEQEFRRIARAFEVQARRSGKKDVQISDLKQALKAEAKKHRQDVGIWEKEFDRLLKAYDAAGRKIANLEADIEHRKQAAKEKVDSRNSTEIRNKIKKLKADLQQQALGKSGERYIPRGLMNAIVEVCDAIDDSSDFYKADGSLNKGQAERNAVAERLRDLQSPSPRLAH